MMKLKPGEAPGLDEIAPARDGTRRFRWLPAPKKRARGFKSIILLGRPGTPIDAAGWQGYGFDTPPDGLALTLDGPPLGFEDAASACRQLAAASTAQRSAAPAAPRPVAPQIALNAVLDRFIAAAEAGEVKTREQRTGRLRPITPKTVETYRYALKHLREIAGDLPARDLTREEFIAICDTLIEQGKHTTALSMQRTASRAFNWLRKDAMMRPLLPDPEAYSRLELGTPAGRARMASQDEAEAMFEALRDPAALAGELGINDPAAIPPARPAAAAAWQMALWTAQRGIDVLSFHDGAFRDGRLYWTQSKRQKRINLPLLPPAREALKLARAVRAASGVTSDRLFIDTQRGAPYRQDRNGGAGSAYYRNFNEHWRAARDLAGRKIPSLIGAARDPFGEIIPALNFADARDTAVTRLFEAHKGKDGALASIATWHGSNVKTLLELLRNYLDLNPRFADAAGEALRQHAGDMGFDV